GQQGDCQGPQRRTADHRPRTGRRGRRPGLPRLTPLDRQRPAPVGRPARPGPRWPSTQGGEVMLFEERRVVDDIIHDAHHGKDRIVAREVAADVVDEVRNLEASGATWVESLIDSWLLAGAMKACADWRRGHLHKGRTKKGAEVDMPIYGAVRDTDDAGETVYVQLHLFTLTLEQARIRRQALASQRDTLSAEVRWFTDVIELMEANPELRTVGD